MVTMVTSDPPSKETAEQVKSNAKVKALINVCIEASQIIHAKLLKTAKKICNALKSVHQRVNLSSKLFLLLKLFSQKLNESDDVIGHANSIMLLKNKLFAIGEEIADSYTCALLLCFLPHSYDLFVTTVVTTLEACKEKDLNLEFD